MTARGDDTATFEAERPRLVALAYRMLGSMTDAEDVVQDVWLRWERLGPDGRAAVTTPAAWLTTATSRMALDVLRSARHRREAYVGPWLPEPVITDDDPAERVELAESLTIGFLAVLERLTPVERAVFLLADVFGEPYAHIAAAVDRSEEACRQIASRARRRVRDDRRHVRAGGVASVGADHRADAGERDHELVRAFLTACALGEVDQLRRLVLDDVVLTSDGGASVRAARRPVVGAARVVRLLTNLVHRFPDDGTVTTHHVNGQPGAVFRRRDRVWLVLALDVVRPEDAAPTADGDEPPVPRVAAVHLVLNPDKLRAVSSVPA